MAVPPAGDAPGTFRNPVIAGRPGDDHGDPFIIRHLGSYFLYHTGETTGRRGVAVHRSDDLVHWEQASYAVEPADTGWAWSDLWAPEVLYERGVFYMYVSAASRRTGPPHGWDAGESDESRRRLGIARATSPLGPFVWDERPLLDEWSIDGHPFRDDDGSMWLFYNVRREETRYQGVPGTGNACDRLLAPDRVAGSPTLATVPSQPWEGPYGDMYWNEGPFVLKRRGVYYQLYSGGFFRDSTYGIGLARAPSPRGPWVKDEANPVFSSGARILGPGHNSFVFGADAATRYAVYHGYVAGEEGRKVHLDRLHWTGDGPLIAGPTEDAQAVPPQAVFDDAVQHWRAEAWARGAWVEVVGRRFALDPPGVWHQVEAVQSGTRVAVRVGGVLRGSYPRLDGARGPGLAADADLTAVTLSTFLSDEQLHELPAGSEHIWRWGGSGRVEVSLAVRGEAELALDGAVHRLGGEDERYHLADVRHGGDVGEIVVRAGAAGACVTDLVVHHRG